MTGATVGCEEAAPRWTVLGAVVNQGRDDFCVALNRLSKVWALRYISGLISGRENRGRTSIERAGWGGRAAPFLPQRVAPSEMS